ncbi:hypothetical protein NST38_31420 [Paenibacillus sp. FSL H8-0104]|uniref:hypothetical protein n=1 Tax=Paenibacillus sp. FSL H8-0104 TaxID=2954509 RepID=UPI0030FD4F09
MARTSQKLIKNGNVQIYDKNRPPLPAGSYTVTYSQEITGEVPFSSSVREQQFQIDGPRFSINELEIKSKQPYGKGIYWNVTPNITFINPKLPWLRQLKAPYENTPWMALLVLREDEWNTEEGQPESAEVGTFLKRDDILVPSIQGNYDPGEICKYVQLPLGKARTLLPESDEMEFLSQARLASDPSDQLAKEQEVSLILSKRLPYVDQSYEKGQRFICYLVSIEGQEAHLTSTTEDDKQIGLIVLNYWSFISQPESGESFRELMQHLLKGVKEQPQDAWLKYPEEVINQLPVEARPRLQDGYVPLCYHTWSGEETMTWYRGPLIPNKDHIERPSEKPNYTSYEGMIYDPEVGLFDNSWSVAWQLGRSIALADESFPALLAHWRKLWGQYFDQVSVYGLSPVPSPELDLLQGLTRDSGWGSNVHQALVYNSDVKVPTVKREAWRKKKRIKRGDPIERIRRVMEDLDPDNEDIAAKISLANTNDVDKARSWLEQLANLDSLLLPYFVSDERMLPMNAIRFFHVDQQWIEFLLDGAASLGVQNEFDVFINRWIRGSVNPDRPKFGMLLRSSLVSRWPGLQVEGLIGTTRHLKVTGVQLQEQIAAYFFDDVPDCIQIIEPHTVLTYGMNTDGTIMLRNISEQQFGEPTGPSISIMNYVDNIGVIKIRELQQDMNSMVQPQPHDPWRPAHFVLQMINGADLGEFKFN